MTDMALTAADLACIAGQLHRSGPGAFATPVHRVARRCPWEIPAVIEDLPYAADGTPFPTLFYATCPTLVLAVAAVEDGGGVASFTDLLRAASDDAAVLRASLRAATAAERRRRRRLARGPAAAGLAAAVDGGASLRAGIGGVADSTALKCLHSHAAHALVWPGYALGGRILHQAAAAGSVWCEDARCRRRAGGAV